MFIAMTAEQWRFMVVGGVNAGKTTLIQALKQEPFDARKTQVVNYTAMSIDTPGEYAEMGHLRQRLQVLAFDAKILLVVQDATRAQTNFPPNYFLVFPQVVVGVVTKMDLPAANPDCATQLLRRSGVRGEIFYVSAINGSGLAQLRQNLFTIQSKCKRKE